MPNIGPLELIVVLIVALVVLGPKKLPQVGRSVGRGMREFKDAISGDDRDDEQCRLDEGPRLVAEVPATIEASAGEDRQPAGAARS